MGQMEGLGRLFNLVDPADNVYVSLADASGVTFEGLEVDGATSVVISTAEDSSGTGVSTTDTLVDHFFERSNDQNDGIWVRTAVDPASATFTPTNGTGDNWAVYVAASALPDGHSYVKANADAGTCVAVLHDLAVQRTPENLRSVTA